MNLKQGTGLFKDKAKPFKSSIFIHKLPQIQAATHAARLPTHAASLHMSPTLSRISHIFFQELAFFLSPFRLNWFSGVSNIIHMKPLNLNSGVNALRLNMAIMSKWLVAKWPYIKSLKRQTWKLWGLSCRLPFSLHYRMLAINLIIDSRWCCGAFCFS